MLSQVICAAAVLPLVNGGLYPRQTDLSWLQLPGSLYQQWASCADATWPPTDIGEPLQPQTPDAELQGMLAEIDPARIEDTITTLVGFGTRHTLSENSSTATRGIAAARDWIYDQFETFAEASDGGVDVYLNSYIQQPDDDRVLFPVNISNVVLQVNGTEDPNRVYVITGHYDTRCLDYLNYTCDAPGADDDASGVSVVMELARICATRKPKATMIFAPVAGEEQNLYGSSHLAKTLKRAGYDVEGHWNNDLVGTGKNPPHYPINDYTIRLYGASIFYPNDTTSEEQLEYGLIGGQNDSPAQNLGRFISEVVAGAVESVGMQVALIYRADRYLRGGDHLSFLEQGFPAVRFTEAVENNFHQHQNVRFEDGHQYGDLIEYVDFEYTARVARTNLASMWSAANAPGLPRNVSISEAVGFTALDAKTPPENMLQRTQLCWNTGKDPLVASYEVVWRTTGNSQWTNVLDVGNVGNVTVGLLKDDFQFGVRAVGADGKKSPAVFPEPTESC